MRRILVALEPWLVIDHLVLVLVPVVVVFGGDPGGVFAPDSVAGFGGHPECFFCSVVYPAELVFDSGDHDHVTFPSLGLGVEQLAIVLYFNIGVSIGFVPVQSWRVWVFVVVHQMIVS